MSSKKNIGCISKVIIVVLFMVVIGWLFKNDLDLGNEEVVREHLKKYTFEHFERKASMTSFIQFYETICELSIYLNGKEFSVTRYKYSIGKKSNDRIEILLQENTGRWDLKEDGDIYMYNEGELFIYHHKEL